MSKPFDAYHQWLGIPPADQPANHYRLLGIDLFEEDLDVISTAADQRMAYVRSFQLSNQSEQSQQLLNELSNAKVCLLNSDSRTKYDASLQPAMLGAESEQAEPDEAEAQEPFPEPVPGMDGPPPVSADAAGSPGSSPGSSIAEQMLPTIGPPITVGPPDTDDPATDDPDTDPVTDSPILGQRTSQPPFQPPKIRRTPRRRQSVPIGPFLLVSVIVIGLLFSLPYMKKGKSKRKSSLSNPPALKVPAKGGNRKLAGRRVVVESNIIRQNEDGIVFLPVDRVRTTGQAVNLDNGFLEDWPLNKKLYWDLLILNPGFFKIQVTYSAENEGGRATFSINKRSAEFRVYQRPELITEEAQPLIHIARGGRYRLKMRVTSMPSGKFARVKSVQLKRLPTRANRR